MSELDRLIQRKWPELESETRQRIVFFHKLLSHENKKQNLTRLISPEDFFFGHLVDVRELLAASVTDYPAMDLGSGPGVPGLLSAMIQPAQWNLLESEKRKAEFLENAVKKLDLSQKVRVVWDRGEIFLKNNKVDSIVVRAVGPLDRIYDWIGKCSTWNNIVLLKGPAWRGEWKKFQESPQGRKLTCVRTHEYSDERSQTQRIILRLDRVPCGTQ